MDDAALHRTNIKNKMTLRRLVSVCFASALMLVELSEGFCADQMPNVRTGTVVVTLSAPKLPNSLPPTSLHMSGSKDNEKVDRLGDFYKSLGPIAFIPGYLFVGQICFLIAAKLNSGLDNLYLYGDLGNQYIRSHGGYDQSKNLLERQLITQQGQKVWFDNVVRDLQHGGPMKPPLTEPLP